MWPPPWARSTGSAALVTFTTPNKLASTCSRKSVERDVLDRRQVGVSRVVDHDVDPAERRGARADRGHGGRRVGDVEFDGEDPAAVAVHQVGQAGGVAGGRDEVVPGRERGLGYLAAETPAAPGEKEDLRHDVLLRMELNETSV